MAILIRIPNTPTEWVSKSLVICESMNTKTQDIFEFEELDGEIQLSIGFANGVLQWQGSMKELQDILLSHQ